VEGSYTPEERRQNTEDRRQNETRKDGKIKVWNAGMME
jgi:hypothetical protein